MLQIRGPFSCLKIVPALSFWKPSRTGPQVWSSRIYSKKMQDELPIFTDNICVLSESDPSEACKKMSGCGTWFYIHHLPTTKKHVPSDSKRDLLIPELGGHQQPLKGSPQKAHQNCQGPSLELT